jgi:hypothetical protein
VREEEAYSAFESSHVLNGSPEADCIALQVVVEYLRYHNRWEEMCQYTQGSPLTAVVVGRAFCVLLELRNIIDIVAPIACDVCMVPIKRRTRSLLE